MENIISSKKTVFKSEYIWGYFFVLPWLLFFCIFLFYPLFLTFANSFLDISLLQPEKARFTGFENWINVIKNKLFWLSIFNVLYNQTLFIGGSLLLSLFITALLNEVKNIASIFRTIYFIPVLVSGTVAMFIYDYLIAPSGGIQTIMMKIGILSKPVMWRFTQWLPMPILAIFSCWKWFGVQVIILLGGISSIDKEIYDAADIDGAGWIKRYLNITIPLLKPQIVFIVTMNIIYGLQMFTEVWVQQRDVEGGAYHSFLTPVLLLYGKIFQYDSMGYASTIGIYLAILIFVITKIQLTISNRDNGA